MWLILLQAKSEAEEAIKRIQARVEAECRKRMQVLHGPRWRIHLGKLLCNKLKYCDELGMQRHLTVPYSPAERGGRAPKLDHR